MKFLIALNMVIACYCLSAVSSLEILKGQYLLVIVLRETFKLWIKLVCNVIFLYKMIPHK